MSRKEKSPDSRRPRPGGRYTSQACAVCRLRKIRCDGVKPICNQCSSSGRDVECKWGESVARKPRTQAIYSSLSKRVEALEEYVNLLESRLEICRRNHPNDGLIDMEDLRPPELLQTEENGYDSDEAADLESRITDEICIPAQNLKLDHDDLVHHNITSVFRFDAGHTPAAPISRIPVHLEPTSRYVLLISDELEQDQTCYNSALHWDRYLPSNGIVLSRREHDRCLDLLFKFLTCWCLRVIPELFLRDMFEVLSSDQVHSSGTPKTSHYSPMLHNALVSVALAFSDNANLSDYNIRQVFANEAKSYIEREAEKPTLTLVHALSILATFHSSNGDQSLGYLFAGMSSRVSQALGLSVDCSQQFKDGTISKDLMLDRNWTYWTVFAQETCWSLFVGREAHMPTSTQKYPIAFPYIDSNFDQLPWHHAASGLPPQPNYLVQTFAASCQLMMITRRIMDVVSDLSIPKERRHITDELVSKIDVQLHAWEDNLLPELKMTAASKATSTPHKLIVHLSYWWSFILLHRPFFYRRKKQIINHVKICRSAAAHIMDYIAIWRKLYTLRYVPITLIQIVFAAGTVWLLSAADATSGMRIAEKQLRESLEQAEMCIQYLLESGQSFNCASVIARILRDLMQNQLKPLLDQRSLRRWTNPEKSNGPPACISEDSNKQEMQAGSGTDNLMEGHALLSSLDSASFPNDPSSVWNGGNSELSSMLNPQADNLDNFFALLGGESFPNHPFVPMSCPESDMYTSPLDAGQGTSFDMLFLDSPVDHLTSEPAELEQYDPELMQFLSSLAGTQ